MDTFARYPSLKNRSVFITGGGSGIGASIVEHFVAQGAKVSFVDIDADASNALVDTLAHSGAHRPRSTQCDLKDIPALQQAIVDATAAQGPIIALVNNAANDTRHTWDEVTVAYWDDRMQVNLRHQFFAAQAVFPQMRDAGGGSIVNIGSSSWYLGQGGYPGYTAAKSAILGLTRGLARDFGASKVRVNHLVPGWIMTPRQIELWLTPESEAELLAKQCLKEKVYPPDVARLTLWLAADDSRRVTSSTYVVDGGSRVGLTAGSAASQHPWVHAASRKASPSVARHPVNFTWGRN